MMGSVGGYITASGWIGRDSKVVISRTVQLWNCGELVRGKDGKK